MYEDFAPKLAKIITEYSQPVSHGDYVVIMATVESIPMAQALYEAVLKRGGHPTVVGATPGLGELFFTYADEHQLTFIDPVMRTAYEKADIIYTVMANDNTKKMGMVDPNKLALSQKSRSEVFETFMSRIGSGELGWCGFPYPTNADAQEAEMGLLARTKFIYEACKLELEDPLEHWRSVRADQQRLVDFLNDKSEAHIKGPGIDLTFSFKDRLWVNCWGEMNFPDGEIYTGPVEDSVNGVVEFNMRTVYGGREVNGVRFEFGDGVIIDATAQKNEEFLLSQLDMDEGARRLGEFAIGTNWDIQQVTGNTLYDEKIGGSIHMAVGRSIPETKGVNVSGIHWDMVHDMKNGGEIYIDGELFYREGHFVV
ncbi:MAG: aminopeptidase [Chloroflexi bacterium]|nr:aminopeptidase [Chloroflexota bacterium]